MELTYTKLLILRAIERLSQGNEFKMVHRKTIAKYLNKDINTINFFLVELKKMGLVENPVKGGWRLTEDGKRVLEQLRKEAEGRYQKTSRGE